jgi:hypothetical protein
MAMAIHILLEVPSYMSSFEILNVNKFQPMQQDFYPRRGMYFAAPFEGELYRARIESVEREQDGRSDQWIDIVEVHCKATFISMMFRVLGINEK